MDTITHRELRNNSSDILRRVEVGESFTITNHGVPVAVISPVGGQSAYERMKAAGMVRPATKKFDFSAIKSIKRTDGLTTQEILDDVRGDR